MDKQEFSMQFTVTDMPEDSRTGCHTDLRITNGKDEIEHCVSAIASSLSKNLTENGLPPSLVRDTLMEAWEVGINRVCEPDSEGDDLAAFLASLGIRRME